MDIAFGDLLIHIDKTVALFITMTPLMAMMTIPKVVSGIKRLVYIWKRKNAQQRESINLIGYKRP